MAEQREAAAKYGHRQFAFGEYTQDAPEPDAANVLIKRLRHEIAFTYLNQGHRNFANIGLCMLVPIKDRILRPFLAVQHEVNGEPLPVRPLCIGRVSPVTDEVAGIVVDILCHRAGCLIGLSRRSE